MCAHSIQFGGEVERKKERGNDSSTKNQLDL